MTPFPMPSPRSVVPPRLVGVVNITQDSFSDGGRYLAPEDALAHARRLRSEGADVLAAATCKLIVMHSVQRTGPATRVATDAAAVWAGIERFFAERLTALQAPGIQRERLIIDPGLGCFLGSSPEPSLAVLSGIRHLKARFGLAVLVSPSRKSFLRRLTGRDTARIGPATLAAELYAVWQGVDYVRTHDVAGLRDALTVLDAFTGYHSHRQSLDATRRRDVSRGGRCVPDGFQAFLCRHPRSLSGRSASLSVIPNSVSEHSTSGDTARRDRQPAAAVA